MQVRGHVLSSLSLLILTARSRKDLPAPGATELSLTPDAEAALEHARGPKLKELLF